MQVALWFFIQLQHLSVYMLTFLTALRCSRKNFMAPEDLFFSSLQRVPPAPRDKNNKCKGFLREPGMKEYCVISIGDGVANQTFIWTFPEWIFKAKARNFPVRFMSVCSVSSEGDFTSALPARAFLAQSHNLSIHKQQGQAATAWLKMAPTNHPPHVNSISLS